MRRPLLGCISDRGMLPVSSFRGAEAEVWPVQAAKAKRGSRHRGRASAVHSALVRELPGLHLPKAAAHHADAVCLAGSAAYSGAQTVFFSPKPPQPLQAPCEDPTVSAPPLRRTMIGDAHVEYLEAEAVLRQRGCPSRRGTHTCL